MRIKENINVIIEKHPYFKDINKKLIEESKILDYSHSYETNVKGKMTSYRSFPKEGEVIRTWITSLILDHYSYLSDGRRNGRIVHVNSWIARYDKGDHTVDHDHHPLDFSYSYYINCPKGSSPLVFTTSGKRIKAEDGKVVIFPGIIKHYVPKNRCDNRIVMAGNIQIQ